MKVKSFIIAVVCFSNIYLQGSENKSYQIQEININKLSENPFDIFQEWKSDAEKKGIKNTTLVSLAQIINDKGIIYPTNKVMQALYSPEHGAFILSTHINEKKQLDLDNWPQSSLCFYWSDKLHKQIRINGTLRLLDKDTANQKTIIVNDKSIQYNPKLLLFFPENFEFASFNNLEDSNMTHQNSVLYYNKINDVWVKSKKDSYIYTNELQLP
jgi:hypothetical protein